MERISTDIIAGHGGADMEENKKENVFFSLNRISSLQKPAPSHNLKKFQGDSLKRCQGLRQ